MIKSKVNGLIIGATPVTSEVTRLGRGKFADFHHPKAGASKNLTLNDKTVENLCDPCANVGRMGND